MGRKLCGAYEKKLSTVCIVLRMYVFRGTSVYRYSHSAVYDGYITYFNSTLFLFSFGLRCFFFFFFFCRTFFRFYAAPADSANEKNKAMDAVLRLMMLCTKPKRRFCVHIFFFFFEMGDDSSSSPRCLRYANIKEYDDGGGVAGWPNG